MNILYIHCTSDLYGASRCLLYGAERQIQDGHRVCVIMPGEGKLRDALERVGAEVNSFPYDPTLRKTCVKSPFRFCRDMIFSIIAYRRVAQSFGATIIHTNTSVSVPGGIVARSLKIPHICHVRESYREFSWLWKLYQPFLWHFSDRIVCISHSVLEEFSERNQRSEKLVFLYDGLGSSELEPVSRLEVEAFKRQFDLNEFTCVGLVGRIILHRKGQDVFVKAAALLKEKYPLVRFLIVGGCYPGNEYHLENLTRLIDELGLCDRAVLTGEMDNPKPAFGACDISVTASGTAEPFGLVTVEAMAQSKPVVGTNLGGTREIIQDDITGILVPPSDPQAMANAIARLLDDAEIRQKMGRAGRKRVEEAFSFDAYYEALMNVYESFVDENVL